jgi:glutamate carboxypeptidase
MNLERARASLPWMTDALEELVSCESPSNDAAATLRCQNAFAAMMFDKLGAKPEQIQVAGITHQRWTFGVPRILLLGHLDTVWPLGTLARWPFTREGDTATGPGIFDMKAGVIQALCALTMLDDLDGVSLLLTSDEEVGSTTSARLVVDSARGCAATLVCEPSADGALKTERKGIAMYGFDVTGVAAHAGLEPEKGANAGLALAHAVLGAASLGNPTLGTTVTPTLLSAGTTTNTVPATAHAALDVRAVGTDELHRVEAALLETTLAAELSVPGTRVELTGGINRPPLQASASSALYQKAALLAGVLGLPELRGVAVGGGSDGNFTAGAGIPTLDGLGAVGAGAHAEGEHVQLSAMAERAALLGALVAALRD